MSYLPPPGSGIPSRLGFSPLRLASPYHRRAQPLRHDAFEAHAARVDEEQRAVLVGVVAEDDAEAAPAQQPARRFLRSTSGWVRRSWPSNSKRSKAYIMASVTVPRRWRASKMATPSGPHTTASPSGTNDLARNSVAVTEMAGYRALQS
jgi:hypothetical protein